MGGKQHVVGILLGTAMMLCLSGCATENKIISPTFAALQTEAVVSATDQTDVTGAITEETSLPTGTESTEAVSTEPPDTQPDQTQTAKTEPPETTSGATESESTEPVETQPAVEPITADPVIHRVVTEMAQRMPEIKYDPSWSGGTVVRMPQGLDQSEEAMINDLLSRMLDLFADAMAGEDPQETVEYTYSLDYVGPTEENDGHLFTVSYTSIGEKVEKVDFDGSVVAAQVTQAVLNSSQVSMTAFDGSDYTECIAIREVPLFYTEQDAVEYLIDAVETRIYTQNILGAEYQMFCFTYGSEEETNHVFLLYLK